MKIKTIPWRTPNFITGEMPPRKREEGFNPDAVPKWHISEVDPETLSEMCDQFRADIFEKAGKKDPVKSERREEGGSE